jgi:hypothetical protein
VTASHATRLLLSMNDVDAATIADGDTIVWDEEAGVFVPSPLGAGGGGGGVSTQTQTATTDPDSYDVAFVFDLGHATVVTVTATLTATVDDGETFGAGAGELGLAAFLETSPDGVTFYTLGSSQVFQQQQLVATIDQPTVIGVTATARYLRVSPSINTSDYNPYAGPNHPTATVQVDVEAL